MTTLNLAGAGVQVFSNLSMAGSLVPVRALVVTHGTNRNVADYLSYGVAAAKAAGVEHDTLVVAPLFDTATWPTGDWKDGKGKTSSFAVMDALLALLVDKGRFPNLAHITVVGHSAGAQFTQRYAALGKAPDQVSYAVANPSSYVYFDPERPGPTTHCSGYDTYKYGLNGRTGYVGELTGAQAKAQYLGRQVTLLLGGDDTVDNGDLDTNCEAMAQGPHRLARGSFFHDRYPRDRVVIPGVGHDAARMFASPLSWPALFGPRSTPPVTSPAAILALNGLWKLTLPTGSPGSPTEVSGAALNALTAAPYFRTTADGGVAFRAPVNGVTTSGSSYPRSELREMNSDGSKAAWSSTDGKTHTLTVTEAFTHLPEGKPHLVGAQIHDASNDISVFRLEGSTLYVTSGNTTHFAVADSNYVLGTPFEAKYVVSAGKIRAYYNGALVTTIDAAFSGAYFKAGAYTQANCTNSSPCSDANYGETVIYKLAVSHGADVPTPVPAPVPVPGPSGQTLGVGGIAAPAGAILATADSTAARTFTAPGVYDGQGHAIGSVTLKGNGITVQNYHVVAGGQYGAVLDGDDLTLQNCDIKGVTPSGDGDLNAITFFGNRIKIRYNTAENFIDGDPGGSHSDFAQAWVSSSHPTASSDVEIVGNRATGPANPQRDPKVPSIHQAIMAEDYGRGGNSGGSSSGMRNWRIVDNYFGDSWNQCIKLDGVDDVVISGNTFAGSSDKVMDVPQGSNVKFYASNIVGVGYGSVGVPVTPGSPVPTPTPVPVPTPTPAPSTVIMIIRHGEKDDDHDGTDDVSHGLSKRGQQRALAIRDRGLFINPRADLAVPTYVLASLGGRMEQTARPTADRLKLPIDVSLDVETAIDATAKLLVAKAKTGHVVWAVVEHKGIPALLKATAKLLGCTDKLPSSHADDDFHTGYTFRGAKFSIWQESVLPGDPGYTVPVPPLEPPVIPTPPPVEPPIEPAPPAPAPLPDWLVALIAWLRKLFGVQ